MIWKEIPGSQDIHSPLFAVLINSSDYTFYSNRHTYEHTSDTVMMVKNNLPHRDVKQTRFNTMILIRYCHDRKRVTVPAVYKKTFLSLGFQQYTILTRYGLCLSFANLQEQ